MKTHNIDTGNGTAKHEDVVIVYSSNLKLWEQHSFLDGTRTFVLACSKDTGYVAVGIKMEDWGYSTVKQWTVEYPGAFSFEIPATDTYHIKCVPVSILLAQYRSMREFWETITKDTRSDVILPVTRGNTA